MSVEGSGGLHVLVTGASSGIGEATARALAAAGHRVTLAGRRAELLESIARDLNPSGKRVVAVPADVTLREDRERLVRRAASALGPVEALVNNAGVGSGGWGWWSSDPGAPERVIGTNLMAAVELTGLVLPGMLERRRGHVINVGSVLGRYAPESLYAASKFGLRGFSLGLRRELLGTGVDVSLVSPGFVRTDMTRGERRLPLPGPEVVARAIVRLLDRPRAEVVVPGWYRLLLALAAVAPGLGDRYGRVRAPKA